MDWSSFVQAASATNWFAYLGTADDSGRPHVSVVAPGFSHPFQRVVDAIDDASRRISQSIIKIEENRFHTNFRVI